MNSRWMIAQGRTVLTAGAVLAVLLLAGGWLFSHPMSVSANQSVILLPAAMYHSVTDAGDSPAQYVISPSMLESDLQYLQAHGRETVTIHDLLAYVQDGAALPEKPVLLTFDDGYYNNYKYAYPLLKQYGMQAVLSPVASLTERFSQTDEAEQEAWSYCTGRELREMADSGVFEIQNHSYDFHELKPRKGCLRMAGETAAAYRQCFLSDTQRAQDLFVSLGIEVPVCYTYPYGAVNAEAEALTAVCGFSVTLRCEEGVTALTRDTACLKSIRRNNRDGRWSSAQFWDALLAQTEG